MGAFLRFDTFVSFASSVSVSMIATRFLRAFGDGPEPDPFGRPAPGRAPPARR